MFETALRVNYAVALQLNEADDGASILDRHNYNRAWRRQRAKCNGRIPHTISSPQSRTGARFPRRTAIRNYRTSLQISRLLHEPANDLAVQRRRAAPSAANAGWTAPERVHAALINSLLVPLRTPIVRGRRTSAPHAAREPVPP